MLQSGLYNKLVNDAGIQALLPQDQSTSPATSLASQCVHFGRAPKEPKAPFIVIHLPDEPPAAASLDGVSELILGEIQFDSYAPEKNGAKLARQLSRAVRDLLKNFSGALSDGTTISFTDVTADFEDNYEVGGTSFLFRSVLRLRAFYTEGPNTL